MILAWYHTSTKMSHTSQFLSIIIISFTCIPSFSAPLPFSRQRFDYHASTTASQIVNLRCGGDSTIATDIDPSILQDNSATAVVNESISEESVPDSEKAAGDEDLPDEQNKFNSQIHQLKTSASQRRSEGKSFHDSGELTSASEAFHDAACLLQEALLHDRDWDVNDVEQMVEECATCRLHEALCLFKNGEAERCVEVCTNVLGEVDDGASIAASHDTKHKVDKDDLEEENGTVSIDDRTEALKEVDATNIATSTFRSHNISSQVRARAHLRRSKARLALGDLDGALDDAKKSAFMGDRNAVTFYGRLLRDGTSAEDSSTTNNNLGLMEPNWGGVDSTKNSFLEGMMEGLVGNNNPPGSDLSSSLLSSLLASGSGSSGSPSGMGLLGELLSPPSSSKQPRRKKKKNGMIDTLAKSVISNMMKRMEDKKTQKTICNYLKSTNAQQIVSFATIAGIPMKEESAQRLVGVAHSITPRGIRRSIRNIKRGLRIVKTARKILKVIDKYKSVLVLVMLFYWIRSAILEPFPVNNKRTRRLVKEAAVGIVTSNA